MLHSLTRRSALSLATIGAAGMLATPFLARASTSTMGPALDLGYRSGLLNDLHAIYAVRRGITILERYFDGPDQNWGRDIGVVTMTDETLHDLRSVSKSVVSLLYGIALDRNLVPAPDSPLLAAFPEYDDLATDPTRASWTIENALNMTLGTDWNENLPYTDPANSEIAMENAHDRLRFVLDRDIVHPPGQRWSYNGGATALLGALIARGTGQTLESFAAQALFEPLDIEHTQWMRGADNVASAASGLRMTAPDLNRLGQMMLNGGNWRDQQVVSGAWIQRCMTPQTETHFGSLYSNFWYLSRQSGGNDVQDTPMIHAAGNGGQRLYVLPDLDLTVSLFAGAYNKRDDWMTPTLVLQRIILAHLD